MTIRTEDWLHSVQMSDLKIQLIKNILETKSSHMKEYQNDYTLRNGRLYRRVGNNLRWVVPNGARWRICQLCHDESGHFAFDKTFDKVKSEYWFPKMRRFIRKYVSACLNCAYNKKPPGRETGYLHPIPKPKEIFHTIHIDHLGPFVRSKRGNIYILAIIDSFSKFILVKAVRNTKSCSTIKVLKDIFALFGSPKVIISDQGTSFTSAEFKEFSKSVGSKQVLNAVATPRANGQIERYNRTILGSLASMNHDLNESDWDLNLPKLQWSLNNTVNKSTGKTPAEVMFGHRTINPSEGIILQALDNDYASINNESRDTETTQNRKTEQIGNKTTQTIQEGNCIEISDQIREIISEKDIQRNKIRNEVHETISNQQKKMKAQFDKRRAPTKFFKEGDLVMIPNYNQEKGRVQN